MLLRKLLKCFILSCFVQSAWADDAALISLAAAEADNLAGRTQECVAKVRAVLSDGTLEAQLKARAHSIAANCLSAAARFDEATEDISAAIRFADTAGHSVELGKGYRILGNIYARKGAIQAAIDAYGTSVEVLSASDNAAERAYSQVNLASNLLRVGRYLEALSQIDLATQVLRSLESPSLLNARYVEASARMMMGDFEMATPVFDDLRQKAAAIKRIDLQIGATQALAFGPTRMGRFEEAILHHEAALEIVDSLPKNALVGVEIEVLLNAAYIYIRAGQINKAIEASSRLEALVAISPQPYYTAMRDRVLGNLAMAAGEQEVAISTLIQSVDAFHQSGHLELAIEVLFDLCAAAPADEVLFGARVCQLALNVHSAWRSDAAQSAGTQTSLTMLIGLRNYYERAVSYLLRAGRVVEAIGAIGLLHEIEIDHWQSLHPASLNLEGAKALPLVVDADLAEAVSLMMREKQSEPHGSTIAELLTSQREAFKKATAVPLVANTVPSWLACKGCERLIYLQTESTLWVIALNEEHLSVEQKPLRRTELDALVSRARGSLQDPQGDPAALMDELGQLLLPDLSRSDADDGRPLRVIADGSLRQLPFAALRQDKRYIGLQRPVIMETFNSLIRPQKQWTRPAFVHAFGASRGAEDLPPLPDVGIELKSVLQPEFRGPGFNGSSWLDEQFTVEKLRGPWEEQAVVHLASHFVLSSRSESLSYLLTGDGSRVELPRLTELGVDFRDVPLVMLSACSTGLSMTNRFGREVEGLAGAVRRLGADRIVASLWPIADQGTSQFVRFFYAALDRGEPPSRALQTARIRSAEGGSLLGRLQLLLGRGEIDLQHPNVWAAFVVYE